MTISRVLVRAIDNPLDSAKMTVYQKGDIVDVIDAAISPDYGPYELINNIGINVTDGNYANHRAFVEKWSSRLEFEPTLIIAATDTWNIVMSMTNTSASGYGNLTKSKVDNYLTNYWNIDPIEVSANRVEFTEDVFDIAISPYMLNMTPKAQLEAITWTQIDFRQAGGEHDIEGDYSATAAQVEKVEKAVRAFYTVIDHDTVAKKITFTADRNVIFNAFKRDANERLYELLGICMYRISDADVDAIAGLPSRTIDRTQAQVQAALLDKRLS